METKNLEVKKTARGVRIWIEDIKSGAQMADNGFTRGVRYTRTIDTDLETITLRVDPDGPLKVAGKDGKNAIIDISARAIEGFEVGDKLICAFIPNVITIFNGEQE
jgi:hypothetical protein